MIDILFSSIRRALGVFLFIISACLIFAISTFSPEDSSILHASLATPKNLMGWYGAYVAEPMMQTFGYAVLFPITFLVTIALKMLQNKPSCFHILRISALFLTLPIFAGLCTFLDISTEPLLRQGGGFVGFFIKNELMWRFNHDIGFTLAAVISLVGIIISLHITFSEWRSIVVFFTKAVYRGTVSCGILFRKLKSIYMRNNKASHAIDDVIYSHDESKKVANSSREKIKIPDKTRFKPMSQTENEGKVQNSILCDDNYKLPNTGLLDPISTIQSKTQVNQQALDLNSAALKQVLEDFGVRGEITNIFPGPIVTLYELEPSAGTKSSRVINIADDIARSMSAISARIAVIPGKNAIGIELPNQKRAVVYLRELLESKEYHQNNGGLPIILGKNIGGEAVIADLAKMPHLLVAGTTGSGKSVAINTMILSLLYKHSPKTCKLVMIDPKMLELSVYDGIPHLIAPVVTEPKKAVSALKWVVREMEERYRMMSLMGVRNISGYNHVISEHIQSGKAFSKRVQTGFDQELGTPVFENIEMKNELLPYIVVIVDEMADLMLVAGKDIEAYIQRLAQMARAAGIHIIMATQRPSVDVITGVIKANFPTRISFQVTSKIDSRTILGEQGAEQLLGMGDMLYMVPGGRIERVHGPFVHDKEVESIVAFLKAQGAPNYISEDEFIDKEDGNTSAAPEEVSSDLYEKAVAIVLQDRKASTSYLQRCLKIGYNRAASLIERMEKEGIISLPNHVGKREILKG
ncbi:MAG: DNA translocase FtsK 4TM domain-containing protein [Candidatus Lariskella arthropodorum]|uniref:FtsK/SpoIIIE family DNA translocase n=1 Tax=Candidatus Lariskella endosymbiont of Epinotia ramella TaxID=3066224 RepID=UPI0030D1A0B4